MLKNGYVATFEFVKSIFTSVRRLLNRAKLSAPYSSGRPFLRDRCYAVKDFWDFQQPKGRRELFELLLFCDRNSTYESRRKLLDGWWNLCDCFACHRRSVLLKRWLQNSQKHQQTEIEVYFSILGNCKTNSFFHFLKQNHWIQQEFMSSKTTLFSSVMCFPP